MAADLPEISLKVMVLGDAGTGKTSFIRQYVHNFFTNHHKATIGVDYHLKRVTMGDQTVRLQLWDIAGQERYGHMARVYYKNSYGALLIYDVSRPTTFGTVARWKEEIDNRVLLPNGEPLPVVLIGNKCDLDESDVDKEQLDKFCRENGFIGWFDCSAKLDTNIDKACYFLVQNILSHGDLFQTRHEETQKYTPGMQLGKEQRNQSSGCC
jgi:small GTP-binding protein